MDGALESRVAEWLEALVLRHPDRHPGRPGNDAANELTEDVLAGQGFTIASDPFEVLDCERGAARLEVGGRTWPLHAGPYTLPVDHTARLAAVGTLDELRADDLRGTLVLVHGELAREQLLPKSFTFMDIPELREILALLEAAAPAAVVAATGRGSGMAGGLYPYPLIEDGDVDIPNAYVTDTVGTELLAHLGQPAHVVIEAQRRTALARQLTAVRGPEDVPRIVLVAHIDSKDGSPGAVDNATGVAALLAATAHLGEYTGPYRLEVVLMNGEDYYATPGEHRFVAGNEGRWEEIALGVNLDAVGGRGSRTAVTCFGCPEPIAAATDAAMARHPTTVAGEEWYESDHSLFLAHGRPAIALTSTTFRELCASVTHTAHDTLGVVDASITAAAGAFVADLVRSLPRP
jgi:aminopeptidase YwaD